MPGFVERFELRHRELVHVIGKLDQLVSRQVCVARPAPPLIGLRLPLFPLSPGPVDHRCPSVCYIVLRHARLPSPWPSLMTIPMPCKLSLIWTGLTSLRRGFVAVYVLDLC